jgi:hypothetical protein
MKVNAPTQAIRAHLGNGVVLDHVIKHGPGWVVLYHARSTSPFGEPPASVRSCSCCSS